MKKRFALLLVALSVCLLPVAAQAQRQSPLADAPAIRKRLELRAIRLEFGGGGGTTLNQDFYHSVFVNLKLGFHFTDWLSLSAFGGFVVSNMETGFQSQLVDSLKTPDPTRPAPTPADAKASMSKIKQILAAQLEFAPFTGKYSLFGKLFAHYDFYLFGGPGFLNLEPTDSSVPACSSTNTGQSCGVTGYKLGANFGVGVHSYLNQFLALNLELRDIMASINPAGRDTNGDQKANASDSTWQSTYMVSLNIVLYLPATADISP
ncbi:MAG TPA: outer membrane beta-barrel domain-containing protein [Polyangia bacterium]|jgi:outer membrane beta-barrel protein|nr:outer membrane beta-barrel domain-containing protein [Polyangia bacterium]